MSDLLDPVQHLPVPDAVYKWLHAAILAGEFVPGQMLRQEILAKRLGVSRVPLREALQRLESEGQVILHPRRGFAVASLDLEEIEEIFQLRILLEERAAYHSTRARTASHTAQLYELLKKMDDRTSGDREKLAEWCRYNSDFHDILLCAGKHRHISRVARSLRNTVEPYIRLEVALTGNVEGAQAEHTRIFDAFSRGDAYTVAKLCREHCEHTANRLIEGLKARQAAAPIA